MKEKKEFVKPDIETMKNEVVKTTSKKGTVTNCDQLYFRSTPDKRRSNVLSVLKKGTTVEIASPNVSGEWIKVKVDNNIGYCMSKFIEL